MRGYRMGQVDAALRRAAYDIGYKQELINVLEAGKDARRDGRMDDAEVRREARSGSDTSAADHSSGARAAGRAERGGGAGAGVEESSARSSRDEADSDAAAL